MPDMTMMDDCCKQLQLGKCCFQDVDTSRKTLKSRPLSCACTSREELSIVYVGILCFKGIAIR